MKWTLSEQIQLYYWTKVYDTFSAEYQVSAKCILHRPYIYSIFQILVSVIKSRMNNGYRSLSRGKKNHSLLKTPYTLITFCSNPSVKFSNIINSKFCFSYSNWCIQQLLPADSILLSTSPHLT